MDAAEIERLIALIQTPTGDDATLRLRVVYTDRLVTCGAEAQERIIGHLESDRPSNVPVLMTLVAAFKNERAAMFLAERLEAGSERMSEIAGDALGTYATVWSLAALRNGINSTKPTVVSSALGALRSLDDRLPCETVMPLLRSSDRQIRFHAAHLAATAGCLPADTLRDLLRDENDGDIAKFLRSMLDDGR